MRKGFTMIELIFVIVILGILAAVAIPRLAATRDDAEISKAATNIQTLVTDLGSYYTSQGAFNDAVSVMSNVPNPVKTKGDSCFTVKAPKADGEIEVSVETTGLCKNVWELPGLSQLKANIESATGKAADTLRLGGKGVSFE